MTHKFDIGAVVYCRAKDRMLSTARATYTITGLMTGLERLSTPQDRIKYFSEDFERVAFENELSADLARFCSGWAAALLA